MQNTTTETEINLTDIWLRRDPARWVAGIMAGLLAGAVMLGFAMVVSAAFGQEFWYPAKIPAVPFLGAAATDIGMHVSAIVTGIVVHEVLCAFLGLVFAHFTGTNSLPALLGMGVTWGLGTFVASFFFAYRHDLIRRGTTLCFTTLLFAVCAIVFAHSRIIPLTAVANFGLGFALIGTMVSATTIVQHTVSDEMRGRVMGLFPLAMGLSMLNGAPVSAAGQIFGLEAVLPVLAWATLLISGAIILWRPVLRRVNPQSEAVTTPVPVHEPSSS